MSEEYEKTLRELYGRINFERSSATANKRFPFRLDRMRALLAALGNPQQRLRIIHLAGTKGKGSTAALVAGMLQAAGHRVGLYSSPHLEAIEERFRIDGESCSGPELVDLFAAVQRAEATLGVGSRDRATFFEITTAIALEHFARRECDWVALEVGLGGRLDSTNVVEPELCLITSIGLDHQAILGHRIDQIAAEKAGIIKPGVPVVSGVRDPEPAAVIREIAGARAAPLDEIGEAFDIDSTIQPAGAPWTSHFTYRSNVRTAAAEFRLTMPGAHQCHNAAVAIRAIETLQQRGALPPDSGWMADGLLAVQLPARCEYFPGTPPVVLDAAHNGDSIRALVSTLQAQLPRQRPVFVFATSKDKDAADMLRTIEPIAGGIVLTRYENNPRQRPPETLRAFLGGEGVSVVRPVSKAIERAKALAGEEGTVVVCGSFFLAAEARPLLAEAGPQRLSRPTLVSK